MKLGEKINKIIKKPIFVVGCCNSGTTILWQALLNHMDLDGPKMEGQDMNELPRSMKHFLGKQTFRMFAHPKFKSAYYLNENDYDARMAEKLIEVYSRHCKREKRFIEKSPSNSMRTKFLQKIFPDAYFVIIVRNGMAVAEGIVRKRWFDPERPHMAGLKTTIAEATEQWNNANMILIKDKEYLRKSLVVKYEDLVKDTKRVLSCVLEYCELTTANLHIPCFETERNAEQIGRLSSKEKKIIRMIAGEMLYYFGY